MAKSGPVIIVEDDMDDQEIVKEIIGEIGISNKLLFFDRGDDAFSFLKSTAEQPFIILSDVNLPGMTGIELKSRIDADPELRQRSIPFVFFSTSVEKSAVDKAYKHMTVQGFFQKSNSYGEQRNILKLIFEYWKNCRHPNSEA